MFLVGTVLLAYNMVRYRGDTPLDERLSPDGWKISFQPPARFGFERTTDQLSFTGLDGRGNRNQYNIFKLADLNEETTTEELAYGVFGQKAFLETFQPNPSLTNSRERIGDRDAFEVIDQSNGLVVRALMLDNGQGIVISLFAENRTIEPQAYDLFDQICLSVEFRD
ncbi:MAG: hypothetical protein ACYTHJ_11535 [Planctomycetota bacterium]